MEHLQALNEARHIWSKPDDPGFVLYGKANQQRTKYLIHSKLTRPVPALEWGIYIGDAVHCLRSALDQMIYALTADRGAATAYPICSTEKEWFVEAPAMLWSLDERVIALVRDSQPYLRGDAAHSHPLAMLKTLWNLDKHRTIPAAALLPTRIDPNITDTEGIQLPYGRLKLNRTALLEDDAVIAEMAIKADESGLEPKVYMKPHLTFDIAFGRAPIPSALHRKPVVQAFNKELGTYVLTILASASVLIGYADEFDAQTLATLFPKGVPKFE